MSHVVFVEKVGNYKKFYLCELKIYLLYYIGKTQKISGFLNSLLYNPNLALSIS